MPKGRALWHTMAWNDSSPSSVMEAMGMPLFHQRIGPAGMVLTALIAFAALGSGTAQAAPQALALVATEGKVGLTCEGR